LYKHAIMERPRQTCGYTTDDNGRALAVLGRLEPDHPGAVRYLEFVLTGRVPGGWPNRMSPAGRWVDVRGPDDAHGRALWGLGYALTNRGPSRVDTGAVHYDGRTGAGYDGLEANGINENRGAESTLAALGALQAPLDRDRRRVT
jgi:hypothetical protein